MRRGSLKLRLLVSGAASLLLALAIAGFGLLWLFERHVERRVVLELQSDVRQLVGGLDRPGDRALHVNSAPSDPRYAEPLSHKYWQISTDRGVAMLRSRSLWDTVLDLPKDDISDAEVHEHTIMGPAGRTLIVVERSILLPERLGGERIRVATALDKGEIRAASVAFAADLVPSLALLGAFLATAAWVQVTVGLRPLDAVRRRLRDVAEGRKARLGVDFPDEVRPLAAEVDHLLDAQEAAIGRARGRAADLAHGFKTPLTVLAADAEQLRERGETELAEEIAEVTQGLRRHVDRELARARVGARIQSGPSCRLGPAAERVVAVLKRTPKGQGLAWDVHDTGAAVRVDPQDLAEIIGNLAENAVQWSSGVVRILASSEERSACLSVEDDGPGIPADAADAALERGGRLDQTKPGHGLGLAIVRDLTEAYGGSVSLGRSELGGLRVDLRFPADAPPPAS